MYGSIATKSVIEYNQAFSHYTAKIPMIYMIILPKGLTLNVSAALFV